MKKAIEIRLKKSVEIAKVLQYEKVLDLGCGDMKLQRFLPNNVEYTGVDINRGHIHQDLEEGIPSLIRQKKYDVIFINELIEHIENFRTLLIQCRDILSDNGRIIITTPSNFRILYGDFFKGIGEDREHIHCFRKTNMYNLAKKCNLKIIDIKGTYIRFPPLLNRWISIPTNQTIYTEVICYKLIKG